MGMAANLVKWPGPSEPTFIPPLSEGCIWTLFKIGPAVSERFENGGQTDGGRRPTILSSPAAFGSGELKTGNSWFGDIRTQLFKANDIVS